MNKVKFTIIWDHSNGTRDYISSADIIRASDCWTEASATIDLSAYETGDTVKFKLADTYEGLDYYGRSVPGRPMYVDDVSVKKLGDGRELMANGGFEQGIAELPESGEYLLTLLASEPDLNISYFDPENELRIDQPVLEEDENGNLVVKAKVEVINPELKPTMIVRTGGNVVFGEPSGDYYIAKDIPKTGEPCKVFFWLMDSLTPLSDAVELSSENPDEGGTLDWVQAG